MDSVLAALIFGCVFFFWLRSTGRPPKITRRTMDAATATGGESADIDSDDGRQEGDEGPYFLGVPAEPAVGRYRIEYVDAQGHKTERLIEVRSVQTVEGKHAILAKCMLRGANRTFIDDRIASAVNMDTGEVVASVATDAINNYAETDEGKAKAAESKAWTAIAGESDAVSALIYVCRADGQMRAPERAIVAEYVLGQVPHMQVDSAALDNVIKQCYGPVGHRDFQSLLKRVAQAKNREGLERLLFCAEQIVGTQKTIHPQEVAAIEMMRMVVQSK